MSKPILMLVDGDARSLRVLEVSLRKAGFDLITAENLREANEKLRTQVPDLILSETKFDDGDGFELRRTLRERDELKEVPFIFLTVEKAFEFKIKGLELGVEDYLIKPIYIKEIIARIQLQLQRKQRASSDEKRDARTRFVGRIVDMPVVDLVQTIEVSRKSGVIQFIGERQQHAAIYFRDGKVIDAEAGMLAAEDAVYRLLTWTEGEFEVVFRPVRRREVISVSSQALLMEGMRRLDEWTRLAEQLPSIRARFEVDTSALIARLAELPDETNRILRLLDGKRTVMEIIDAAEMPDHDCLQVLVRLYAEGLLIEVTGQSEHTPTRGRGLGKFVPQLRNESVVESLDMLSVQSALGDALAIRATAPDVSDATRAPRGEGQSVSRPQILLPSESYSEQQMLIGADGAQPGGRADVDGAVGADSLDSARPQGSELSTALGRNSGEAAARQPTDAAGATAAEPIAPIVAEESRKQWPMAPSRAVTSHGTGVAVHDADNDGLVPPVQNGAEAELRYRVGISATPAYGVTRSEAAVPEAMPASKTAPYADAASHEVAAAGRDGSDDHAVRKPANVAHALLASRITPPVLELPQQRPAVAAADESERAAPVASAVELRISGAQPVVSPEIGSPDLAIALALPESKLGNAGDLALPQAGVSLGESDAPLAVPMDTRSKRISQALDVPQLDAALAGAALRKTRPSGLQRVDQAVAAAQALAVDVELRDADADAWWQARHGVQREPEIEAPARVKTDPAALARIGLVRRTGALAAVEVEPPPAADFQPDLAGSYESRDARVAPTSDEPVRKDRISSEYSVVIPRRQRASSQHDAVSVSAARSVESAPDSVADDALIPVTTYRVPGRQLADCAGLIEKALGVSMRAQHDGSLAGVTSHAKQGTACALRLTHQAAPTAQGQEGRSAGALTDVWLELISGDATTRATVAAALQLALPTLVIERTEQRRASTGGSGGSGGDNVLLHGAVTDGSESPQPHESGVQALHLAGASVPVAVESETSNGVPISVGVEPSQRQGGLVRARTSTGEPIVVAVLGATPAAVAEFEPSDAVPAAVDDVLEEITAPVVALSSTAQTPPAMLAPRVENSTRAITSAGMERAAAAGEMERAPVPPAELELSAREMVTILPRRAATRERRAVTANEGFAQALLDAAGVQLRSPQARQENGNGVTAATGYSESAGGGGALSSTSAISNATSNATSNAPAKLEGPEPRVGEAPEVAGERPGSNGSRASEAFETSDGGAVPRRTGSISVPAVTLTANLANNEASQSGLRVAPRIRASSPPVTRAEAELALRRSENPDAPKPAMPTPLPRRTRPATEATGTVRRQTNAASRWWIAGVLAAATLAAAAYLQCRAPTSTPASLPGGQPDDAPAGAATQFVDGAVTSPPPVRTAINAGNAQPVLDAAPIGHDAPLSPGLADAGSHQATANGVGNEIAGQALGRQLNLPVAAAEANRNPTDASVEANSATDPEKKKKRHRELIRKARAALDEGDNTLALAYAQESLNERTTAAGYVVKADAMRRLDRTADALYAVEKAVTMAPDYAPGWDMKGRILWSAKRTSEARAAFEEFLRLDSEGKRADEIRALLGK